MPVLISRFNYGFVELRADLTIRSRCVAAGTVGVLKRDGDHKRVK